MCDVQGRAGRSASCITCGPGLVNRSCGVDLYFQDCSALATAQAENLGEMDVSPGTGPTLPDAESAARKNLPGSWILASACTGNSPGTRSSQG